MSYTTVNLYLMYNAAYTVFIAAYTVFVVYMSYIYY